jgi:hypothetical protein
VFPDFGLIVFMLLVFGLLCLLRWLLGAIAAL